MADYELGTAHGRIVVDYDDRGIAQAEKSLDRLQRRSRELLGQFATMAKGWISNARDMGRQSEQLTNQIEGIAKATAVVAVSTAVLSKSWGSVIPGVKVLKDLKEAFGGLPDGAERFPTLIQRIMRVAAAVSLFHGATGLLARATRNIAGISTLTRGLASFGGVVNNLAAPLRFVSSAVTGFLTVLKGIELVKKYAKYFELFHVGTTGLAAGLNFVLPLIAKLAEDIKNLGGVLALAPAALGVFGLALGTLKVGLSGFGDALKAIGKGDAAAFNKALKDMAPAAQETARALKDLYEKAWKPLQKAVQAKLFDGMAPVLKNLAGALLPAIERAMLRVATSFNGAAKEVAAFLSHPEVAQDFGEGMDYTAQAVQNLTRAFAPLTEAFYLIWRVGTEVMADITKGAGSAAERFRDFIREARASGELEAFMRRGVKAVQDLVTSVINFGKIFSTIFKGLGISGGDGFLAWLAKATEQFNNFLKSAQGQEILKAIGEWMRDGAEHAKALAEVFLNDVLPAIQAFLPFIKAMGDAVNSGLVAALKVLAPLFKVIGEVLSALAPALAPIVTIIVFLGTVFVGLALAVKIVAGAFAIFKTAALSLRALAGLGGLLAGLGGAVGLLGRVLAGAARLLKGGAIAAGLFLVADGINEMNLKAAGGDPSKLQGMEKTLYNIVEAGKKILSGDIPGILKEIGDQVDQTNKKWSEGEAPIQKWADKVATSFSNDLIRPMEEFGTAVNTFITSVGTTIGTGVSTWWSKVSESFERDVIGFFTQVPGRIGTYIGMIGTQIGTAASTLWQGFLTYIQTGFQPVIAFFSQTPYQMGLAIGEGIGAIITAAINLMTSFGTAVNQGITNVLTFFSLLPGRIAVALATLGSTIFTTVVNAMTQFGTAVNQGITNVITWFTGLPGRVGSALAPLPSQVIAPAISAGQGFLTNVANFLNNAVAFVASIPGRAAAALSSLAGFLLQKAVQAGTSFLNGVTTTFNNVITFIRGIPGKIVSAIGNLGSLLVNAGRAVIDGLLAGIKAGVQAMYDFVSGIADGIARRKGPLPKDRVLLIPAGVAIVQGLVKGMQQTMPALYRQVNGINNALGGVGGVAGSVNLSPAGAVSNVRSLASAPTIPAGVTRGGDGASAGVVNNIGTVTIPAKDIKEFRDVTDFFDAVQQKARAGRSTR